MPPVLTDPGVGRQSGCRSVRLRLRFRREADGRKLMPMRALATDRGAIFDQVVERVSPVGVQRDPGNGEGTGIDRWCLRQAADSARPLTQRGRRKRRVRR